MKDHVNLVGFAKKSSVFQNLTWGNLFTLNHPHLHQGKKPSLSTEIHVPQDLLVTKLHDKEPPTSDKSRLAVLENSGGSTVGQNPGKYLIH